jgi:4-hydroxymandelate oxidase
MAAMKSWTLPAHDRRAFLRFLAASPYVAALGGIGTFAQQSTETADLIGDPKEALNVLDFEEAAHRKVLPGHWAYMRSGVDFDVTLRANREGFQHVQLRPRRLRDATKVDMRTELFGTVYNSPIFTCPTGGEKSFHSDGELAVARATKARGTMQMLSTATSTAVEDVCSAHGRPVWYQLYAPTSWDACQKIVRRVEAAGCPVIALTVDNTTGRNSETYLRTRPKNLGQCVACHEGGQGPTVKERKMYDGIDMTGIGTQNPGMTWEFVDQLRKATKLKLFIKGIDTREDARLAVDRGLDGILVSITAADPRKRDERPSRLFPKSSARSAAAFQSLSTEVFAAEQMCLRRSRWEPRRLESGAHSYGDWELSGRLASTGSSKSFRAS